MLASATVEQTGPVTMLVPFHQSWLPGAWNEYGKNICDLVKKKKKNSAKFN